MTIVLSPVYSRLQTNNPAFALQFRLLGLPGRLPRERLTMPFLRIAV